MLVPSERSHAPTPAYAAGSAARSGHGRPPPAAAPPGYSSPEPRDYRVSRPAPGKEARDPATAETRAGPGPRRLSPFTGSNLRLRPPEGRVLDVPPASSGVQVTSPEVG